MLCPGCGFENRDGATFCGECGESLAVDAACSSCGRANPAGRKFCDGCGAQLAVPAPLVPQREPRSYTPKHLADRILQSKSALEGERKQVTVLFADVKGSIELAGQVGAEEWHRILDRFFQILSEGVHRFEGTINQYTGDGIMALFGAPLAHEDHAQRGCYASLHLLQELRGYAREVKRAHAVDFAVRIGLNSGEVVVGRIGDDLRMDYTAQGQTVGLAQRVESLADPNTCALTASTASLVSGYFDLEDLGEFAAKGVSEPLSVFALRGVGSARTRLDVSRARGFTSFVGRDSEMASLDAALEATLAGNGQVVGVVAEAGTGKSRLCLEFVDRCRAKGIRVNEAHCPAHGKTVAYLPVLEMLRDIFEIGDRDGDHEARRKIAGELMLLDDGFQELLPLIFDFLGVPDPERPPPDLPPEGRQRRLMAFMRHLIQARSEREPTVLLLDDLHWIDAGSDGFLANAVAAAESTRTLWLVNFRPEYHADWMSKSTYRQLPLAPLGPEAIEALLSDLLGDDPSVAGLPARVHERTAGNPFFIEEVIQSLIEKGSLQGRRGAYQLVESAASLEIPATVQSVLAARIDRLGEREKQVLQTASVIGKEIPEAIMRRVTELPDADLAGAMAGLVAGEFIFEKSLYPDVEYAFKHPLTHETAYGSQLSGRRAETHAAVAVAIEETHADHLDERASLLAHHWGLANDTVMAARWHRRAALWCALDNSREAMRHWQRVRELLREVPDAPGATAGRIEAATGLLNLGWRQGLPESEAEAIFREGRELSATGSDLRQRILLLVNRATSLHLSGLPEAGPLSDQALALTESIDDPELRYLALDIPMNVLFYTGNLAGAVEIVDRRLELARAGGFSVDAMDIDVLFFSSWQGHFLLYMGRIDDAAAAIARAEAPIRERGNIQSLCWLTCTLGELQISRGETAAALATARRAVDLAEEAGAGLGLAWAHTTHGAAAYLAGDFASAVREQECALEITRRMRGFKSHQPVILADLGEARLATGDLAGALEAAEEAVRVGIEMREPVFEARAQLALARVLSAREGMRERIEAALARCEDLIAQTGANRFTPDVRELRGRQIS